MTIIGALDYDYNDFCMNSKMAARKSGALTKDVVIGQTWSCILQKSEQTLVMDKWWMSSSIGRNPIIFSML
jgi:hypothetical protein